MTKTLSKNDNSSVSNNDETKPQAGFCLFQSTFGTACAVVLWVLCLATSDCWTECENAVTKASILGFGIFVLFMLVVERACEPDETLCEAMEGFGKELDDIKTWFGKLGFLVYHFTVFATLVAELNCLMDTNTPMWYREQALYMYGFLMYSNAVGTKLWSIVHTLVFALASDSIALSMSTGVIMSPRSIGLLVGYCGMACEIIHRRDDTAFLKEHLPVRSILFFTLIWIPLFCAIWPFAEKSVMNYLVVGLCLFLCSNDLSKGVKSDGAHSWMKRSGAHLFHVSIWTQIALVLLDYLMGTTGTRNLWIIGFLLYAHMGSTTFTNICFVWGISVLGAMNTFGENSKERFPLTTTVAVVRTVIMVLALVDLCLNGKKKEKENNDDSKSDNDDETQVKVLWDGNDASDYVPLVDSV